MLISRASKSSLSPGIWDEVRFMAGLLWKCMCSPGGREEHRQCLQWVAASFPPCICPGFPTQVEHMVLGPWSAMRELQQWPLAIHLDNSVYGWGRLQGPRATAPRCSWHSKSLQQANKTHFFTISAWPLITTTSSPIFSGPPAFFIAPVLMSLLLWL